MYLYFSTIFKKLLRSKGFYKKSKHDKSFFDGLMTILFSENKQNNLIKIIQVGANQGIKSDYLNNILKTYGKIYRYFL